jgi:hypothetical protein
MLLRRKPFNGQSEMAEVVVKIVNHPELPRMRWVLPK